MDILLVLTVGALCIGCFVCGAKVGQKVVKGEEIKTPSLDPFKAYREHQDMLESKYLSGQRLTGAPLPSWYILLERFAQPPPSLNRHPLQTNCMPSGFLPKELQFYS
jgi:hypothetical protein